MMFAWQQPTPEHVPGADDRDGVAVAVLAVVVSRGVVVAADRWADGGAGADQVVAVAAVSAAEVDAGVASHQRDRVAPRHDERAPVVGGGGAPCRRRVDDAALHVVGGVERHGGGVDAHGGVGDGDVEHLHGAIAHEQPGRRRLAAAAGEVEAWVVAAGLQGRTGTRS